MLGNEEDIPLIPTEVKSKEPVVTTKVVGELNLFTATQRGNLEKVTELIDQGEAKATDLDFQKTTALHWAAINNFIHIAQFLLDRGANVDAIGGLRYIIKVI